MRLDIDYRRKTVGGKKKKEKLKKLSDFRQYYKATVIKTRQYGTSTKTEI